MGQAIRALRMHRGMSQQSAANAAQVTKTAWQNYENGRAVVLRTDLQARLAKALGSDRRELMLQLAALTPAAERSSVSSFGVQDTGPGLDPFQQRAVFPLREGEVTLTFPADLSAESFIQLESYLSTFLKARRPAND